MSIAENISRINNAKISMIEAIQSNIDIDLPSGLRIHELAPYITSACQVRYQAGVIAGGGASSSSSSESGGGTLALVATGGSGGPSVLNGDWYDTGNSTSVSGNTYPIYTHTNGNNTYYLQRVHSNSEMSDLWTVTTSPIQSSEWNGWSPSPHEASVIYSWTNSSTPVGCEWYIGSNYDYETPVAPTFSNVGGESSSSSESGGVSFPSTVYVTSSSVAGTYTQTGSYETVNGINYPVYSNGSFYYMFEYDRWKFFGDYPPMSGPYYQADSATTEMVTTYTEGPMGEGSPYPVVSLTPASNVYPDALIVSDAMSTACNGVYYKSNEEFANKPIYGNNQSLASATKMIAYLGDYWRIVDDLDMYNMGSSEYYYGTELTGSYSQGNYGAGPGCTVAEYASSSSSGGENHEYLYTVSNAPTSAMNGYYWLLDGTADTTTAVYTNGSYCIKYTPDYWSGWYICTVENASVSPDYCYIDFNGSTDVTSTWGSMTVTAYNSGGESSSSSNISGSGTQADPYIWESCVDNSIGNTSGCHTIEFSTGNYSNSRVYVRIGLSAGVSYQMLQTGNYDTYLKLYNSSGTEEESNDDNNNGESVDGCYGNYNSSSYFTYTPQTTGYYLLVAGGYENASGTARLHVYPRPIADISGGGESSSSSESLGTISATDRTINGTAYVSIGEVSLQASASNGATCTFSGSLPSGLSMTSAGVITGTCTSAVNDTYSITVSADGCTSTTLTLTVQISLGTISISGSPSITGTAGSSISSVDLTSYASASNGQSCTFSGNMPSGMSLSSGGIISGTPTNAVNSTYQITVSANGCTSNTISVSISIQEQSSGGEQPSTLWVNYGGSWTQLDKINNNHWFISGGGPNTRLYMDTLYGEYHWVYMDAGDIVEYSSSVANTNNPADATWNTITVVDSNPSSGGQPSGGGGGCVLKGTKIALADGSEKNVEDITYDDNLLVWDFDNGCLASAKPAWLCHYGKTDYCWRTEFSNGTTLYVMGPKDLARSHRALSIDDGEFIYFQDIVGKEVATLSGTTELLSCEKKQCDTEYFNIITENHLNFFANDILTSCRLSNIAKIEDMKYVEHSESDIDYSDIPEYYVRTLRLKEQKMDMHNYMNTNVIPYAMPRPVESPCFLRGTKLTLADGTTKNIEDLTYDDELLTWDFDEGKPSAQKPVWIYKGYTNYYGVVEFSNGTTMRVTGDSNRNTHRLYDVVNGSFNYVNTMIGHEVITENGDKVTVDSYEIVDENVNEEYYNIITEHDYNYYINGILASCSLNNKLYSVDESMKYVKNEAKSISHPALEGKVSEKDYEALRVSELPTSVDSYIISVVNSKFHK